MGTLFNQTPRIDRVTDTRAFLYGEDIKHTAEKLGITFTESLELYKLIFLIDDYDTKDEQLTGLGELISELIGALSDR